MSEVDPPQWRLGMIEWSEAGQAGRLIPMLTCGVAIAMLSCADEAASGDINAPGTRMALRLFSIFAPPGSITKSQSGSVAGRGRSTITIDSPPCSRLESSASLEPKARPKASKNWTTNMANMPPGKSFSRSGYVPPERGGMPASSLISADD